MHFFDQISVFGRRFSVSAHLSLVICDFKPGFALVFDSRTKIECLLGTQRPGASSNLYHLM